MHPVNVPFRKGDERSGGVQKLQLQNLFGDERSGGVILYYIYI